MYDSGLKRRWDNKSVLDYAVQEARKKVHEDVALEMKRGGMPLAQITKFTKLSIEEIEKL